MIPPPECLPIYAAASAASFLAMAWDKWRAVRGGRRIRERTLHFLELLGGWPGALLAMLAVNHKRAKPAFWAVTMAISLLHVLAWWVLAPHGF